MMKTLRVLDPWLVVPGFLLTLMSLVLIYSGSLSKYSGERDAVLRGPVFKQLLFLVVGVALMVVLARMDYRSWQRAVPALYGGALVALAVVLVIGSSEYGSRRWISFAGFQLQPSEPAKLIAILLIARLLARKYARGLPARQLLITLGIAAGPALLVFREPDLGTAIIFLTTWLGMVYVAGARARHLALLAAVLCVALPFVMLAVVHGYQKERLEIFFNPERDPLGTGYNVNQAAISIGSGGLTGQGLTKGTQTQFDYLRTQTTDYIFSVLGEELGFVGAMVLFALYLILLFRGLQIVLSAPDDYGKIIGSGIVVMLLSQIFINVGVNTRLFPVTGIPLPFISQGGSSLVAMFMALGVLQSIRARRGSTARVLSYDRLGGIGS